MRSVIIYNNLPPGTYCIEFAIYDVFMRPMHMQKVELTWDGKMFEIQGDSWKGTETLNAADYYNNQK